MKQFEDFFKDLSEMEGVSLEELRVLNKGSDSTSVMLMSEGQTVYEIHDIPVVEKKRTKSFDTHYEVVYHMRRTANGRLQPLSFLYNNFQNTGLVPSGSETIVNDKIFQKLQLIFNIINEEGVLKSSDPNSYGYHIWGDNGIAVKCLDPRSKETRYFYNENGTINKIITKLSITEYFYPEDSEIFCRTRTVYFKENKGELEEDHLMEMEFDDKGRVLKKINRTAEDSISLHGKTETVESYQYDYLFNEDMDDDHCYYIKSIDMLSHQDPSYTRLVFRLDKKTKITEIVLSTIYNIHNSILYAGKYSVIVNQERKLRYGCRDQYSYMYDDIPPFGIGKLMREELRRHDFNEDESRILMDATKVYGSMRSVKEKHNEFNLENGNISIDLLLHGSGNKKSWVLNSAKIKYSADGIDTIFNIAYNANSKLYGELIISTKNIIAYPSEYMKRFVEQLKKTINEYSDELYYIHFLCDYDEVYTGDNLFGIDLYRIKFGFDHDLLPLENPNKDSSKVFSFAINYSFSSYTRDITIKRKEGEGEFTTTLSFYFSKDHLLSREGSSSTHELDISVNTEDVLMKLQRKIISDKNYSDIITEYVGKNTMERIEEWEKQLEKFMKLNGESQNGSIIPRKIMPMSRSEKRQS